MLSSLFILSISFLRKANAINVVPTNVADKQSHKSVIFVDNKAGASECAGFIEAPEINDKKNISKPTIPPIAIPLKPLSPLVYTTVRITAINKAEAKTSVPNTIEIGYEWLKLLAPK